MHIPIYKVIHIENRTTFSEYKRKIHKSSNEVYPNVLFKNYISDFFKNFPEAVSCLWADYYLVSQEYIFLNLERWDGFITLFTVFYGSETLHLIHFTFSFIFHLRTLWCWTMKSQEKIMVIWTYLWNVKRYTLLI